MKRKGITMEARGAVLIRKVILYHHHTSVCASYNIQEVLMPRGGGGFLLWILLSRLWYLFKIMYLYS